MRNLSIFDKQVIPCSLLSNCVAATVESEVLYFVCGSELCKLKLQLSNLDENVEVLVPLDSSTVDDCVLDIKYLPEEDVLVLVSKTGTVTTYHVDSSDVEVVGDVAGGISSCCWSPDMETLVIITETGNVLLMSRMWDVLSEVGLHQEDFGEGKFITVGWGSKETQFHGSEGKESRVKKEVEGKLADWDDKATRTVWRADGLYFAVSAVSPLFGHRTIRVFNREGQLQYTSEKVEELGQSLSWKSSGASGLITSTVSLVHQAKQLVAFFEKNGLRHGEFDLDAGSKVLESFWNGDSTILALIVERQPKEYAIQLWTTSNYHWTLKQSIRFGRDLKPLWLSWDATDVGRLHYVSSAGEYVKIDFKFAVDSSRGLTSSDLAGVAVIDNNKLKVTLLREAVIPPPMCAWQLELPDSINQVAFQARDSNRLAALTSAGQMYLFTLTTEGGDAEEDDVKIVRREGRIARPVFTRRCPLDAVGRSMAFYHWAWIEGDVMVGSCMEKLVVMDLGSQEATVRKTYDLGSRIAALAPSRDQKSLFVQLIDGDVFRWDLADGSLSTHGTRFPEPCLQLDSIDGSLIGLAASGRLYCDGREIFSSISSFAIHSNFLLVTSAQNQQLICTPLDKLISPSAEMSSQRRVERGARLVHAVAMDTKVVLQMPRGNLEAIHPRALTLNVLSHLIDRKCYADAFDLMKKQRINLNLLFDHNPRQWLDDCAEFVGQVGRLGLANLNLFLSELQDEDFSTTMYRDLYRDRLQPSPTDKVATACRQMRTIMEERDPVEFLLPILTSHVRQGQVHLALKAVQQVQRESVRDDALKYLAVLVDAAKLYAEALATYDLQLSLMVANRSQMDPKEYLSFLNELDAMTDLDLRRFTIDNSLKRHESATRHLCRCRPVRTTEIVGYMKLHRTYAAVIDEFCLAHSPETEEALHLAAALQADHLVARSDFEGAGYVFQRVGLHEKALSVFQQCGMWNNCLSLAALLNMEQARFRELAATLVKQLKATRKYRDAAHLCEFYLQDYVESAQCLVEGLHFSDAWALSSRHSLRDFRETTLTRAVIDAVHVIEDRLHQVRSELGGYASRLTVVRQNLVHKLENPAAETDHGDLFSETGSSVFSMSGASGTGSGKTFRSSKNRRKLERKKLQLKEGSAFEDLALIHQLYQLYSSVDHILGDVASILRGGLLVLKDWQQLQQLQKTCESFVKFAESHKKEIWNFQPLKKDEEQNTVYGPSATAEGIVSQLQKGSDEFFAVRYSELDAKMRYAPDAPSDQWKLDVLK